MIKIAHECPLSIFSKIRKITDYDYALVHLFEKEPLYFNLFKESLEQGREVILDNSIFELGEAFDDSRFAFWIEQLSPTTYIIPDVLEDSEGTIANINSWMSKYPNLPGLKMGVVQGKTYEDLVKCYNRIDQTCDMIAISFNYSYYTSQQKTGDFLKDWMLGRQVLIDQLIKDGIINYDKPHHLLGSSLPQEFSYYNPNKYRFIKSLDTSNPIIHGLSNIRYRPYGLSNKISTKLFELIHSQVDDDQLSDIMFNVRKFKELTNG